jgi:GNAT superfamily N-acetyltransferase
MSDIESLCSFDLIAQRDHQRQEFIAVSVASRTCYVAASHSEVVGYGVLNYNFHSLGWIDMLYVAQDHRRQGAGRALVEHMESQCRTRKIFTSTNLSNLPMQTLLAKLGYTVSGVIENLDEGDPEIIYFKRLT